jgi:hypothetical protein
MLSMGEHLLTMPIHDRRTYLKVLWSAAERVCRGGNMPLPVWRVAANLGLMQWKGYLRIVYDPEQGEFEVSDMDIARNERELTIH